jgi:hypothetical protein
MDHDYYDRLTSDERIQVLESIMIWAKWEINSVQRHKEQAQEEFNKHMGLNQ